jgi:1,4-dihydroxy-2-naphthoyl-CoA hydrolase
MPSRRPEITIPALHERQAGKLPGVLGIRVDTIEDGAVTLSMEVEPRHLAPNGYLHAASVIAVADTASGYGCFAHLPDGATGFTTIELKSNFLGTTLGGRISARATLVHGGRTTQVWDATVTSDEDRTLALFRCTQMILWPKG